VDADDRDRAGEPDDRAERSALAPVLEAFSPMSLHVHRMTGAVIGRPGELAAIQQEMASARTGRLVGLTIEGEPGIGKTRLLLAAREMAEQAGLTTIAVTADEELRGPFLLARSILGSREAVEAVSGRPAEEALARCLEAMSGQDDASLASLPADRRLLRTFDLGAVAFRALAEDRGLALLIDDVQWADDDSLRLLRYVVRANAADPILLIFAIRPEELALVTEAVNMVADMDRMGAIRRVKLNRFNQVDTREFLGQVLGGPVDPAGAAVMHTQAEGVPFIVEEMARAYREGGMIQQIDGVWALARNADRLVPSAVKTLISRRAARLPDETKSSLAEAAVLGRHFSLKDLREVKLRVSEEDREPETLAEALSPAVVAGLLIQHPEGSAADYSFPHEQVREFAMSTLTQARQRAIHGAIVEMLLAGEPTPASLPLLAHHAKAAGDAGVCVRFSIDASRNALAANAPEEVLRVVDLALPLAATPQQRVDLLESRDRAFDMLRRPADRMQGLAELSALAEALGDSRFELDVRLRRAAALRMAEEEDRAAELAREVRELAASRGDREVELGACLELGQDLLRSTAGETFTPPALEVDLDGAEEAFRRALEIARELGDDAKAAVSLRELGVIQLGRLRAWFIEQVRLGAHVPIAKRVAAGEVLDDMMMDLPIAPLVLETSQLLGEALELFERVGDRRGAMSTIIAMGFLNWAPDIHLGTGSARHIEEIRRLTSQMRAFTNASERAAFEAQMLYGVHVFARAKVIPDLAVSRGEEAFRTASEIGDHALAFLAAGGTALAHLDLGDVDAAKAWLDRAAGIAAENPTPLRARRLETWRGLWFAAAGDVAGMREHLERAVELATASGQVAARCEATARLAVESARLGAEHGDEVLLDVAERAGRQVQEFALLVSGHPPWPAQAEAALATVALSRGQHAEAADLALSAASRLQAAMQEDLHADVLLSIGRVLQATAAPEWVEFREYIQRSLAMIAQRTIDEAIRVRWFRGPLGRALTELAGQIDMVTVDAGAAGKTDDESVLLRSLIHGRTNQEIAEDMGIDEDAVTRQLGELFARIGASSRAEATAFAFREGVL